MRRDLQREHPCAAQALYSVGSPFLLAGLSTIALCWLQFVRGDGKRQSGLEGHCLQAFALWNGTYAVLATASAVALVSLSGGPEGAPAAARAVARAQLTYEAATAALQGAAYLGFGTRLLERLDRMTGSKRDARVDAFRYRVRRLLVCAGAGSLAVALCLALTATLPPTPRTTFYVVAVGQRAIEVLLAAAAARFGLRPSASGLSGLSFLDVYFPETAKSLSTRVSTFSSVVSRRLKRLSSDRNRASSKQSQSRAATDAPESRVELGSVYGTKVVEPLPEVTSPMATSDDNIFTPMGRTDLGKRADAFASAVEDPLPSGWQSATDEAGATYYVNEALSLSQWERPVAATADVDAEAAPADDTCRRRSVV